MTGQDAGASIEGRIQALSAKQRRALVRALAAVEGRPDRRELTAFIEGRDDELDVDDLRAFLTERLPDHMIPSRFEALDRLPLTPTGKLDRQALVFATGRKLEPSPSEFVAPRTDTERQLAQIWRDVLGIEEISVHDDFFEVGGDSLLSIRVISRAARGGLQVSPEDFFEEPTIARLAERVGPTAPASQGVVVGTAPLTPIQHWFFDRISDGQAHWNQAVLLATPRPLDRARIRTSIRILVEHHDALRTRFIETDGERMQEFPEVPDEPPFRVVDLADVPESERARRIGAEANLEHASLDLAKGRLFCSVLFDDAEDFGRLLLIAHHLIVDAISWGILLDDLSTLVAEGSGSPDCPLPQKTTSLLDWSAALTETAGRTATMAFLPLWLGRRETPDGARRGLPSADRGQSANVGMHVVDLSPEATADLGRSELARDGATLHEMVLAGVLLGWCRWSGRSGLQTDVEGHGRNVLEGELDASRTVGWFTTVFPLSLEPADVTARACVGAVQQAYERLPMRGASHGLLRYLAGSDIRRKLSAQPRSELLFNYLGSGPGALPPDSPFDWADEPTGLARSPDAPQVYPVEVNASLDHDGLRLRMTFDPEVHASADITALGDAVHEALTEMGRTDGGGAAGFELSGLDEAGLQQVSRLLSDIDEV